MGVMIRRSLYTGNWPEPDGHGGLVEHYHEAVLRSRICEYGPYDPADRCFYCHENLSGEAIIMWNGCAPRRVGDKKNPDPPSWRKEVDSFQDLLLNPGCFIEMTTRMFSDLHKTELVFDYHVIKNASPVPPRPGEKKNDSAWKVWRRLRDTLRDLGLVRQ